MSDMNRLMQHMKLKPIVADSLNFVQYLERLKAEPHIADTAPALILRAIKSRGVVEIDKEPVARRPYLELLQAMRVPAWKAFDHVRGSHRTVQRIMTHLEAAAANGYQLRQALLLIGGPGCGKSFLADAIKATLEGELVYVVDGCPVHENPINLLKLLSKEQVDAIAKELDMDDPSKGTTLQMLLSVAGDPCSHCWELVMKQPREEHKHDGACEHHEGGCKHHQHKEGEFALEPDLSKVPIKEMRLSSRTFGVATWAQTKGGCSLVDAIRQGSGGMVDIPEMFSVQKADDGETLEVDCLIDATDGRKIPDTRSCGDRSGYLPANVLIMGQSNQGSWDAFLENQADPDKFTRRVNQLSVPYITVRVEEELAYAGFLKGLKEKPHFDPNALLLAATLAVGSRLKDQSGLSPVDKVRLNNGETFIVRKAGDSSSMGGAASLGGAQWTAKELMELRTKQEEVKDERDREGMFGLTMSFMLSFVGQVAESTMRGPKHPAFKDQAPCVTAIGMIDALRAKLESYKQSNGLTNQQKKIVENLLTVWLKKPEDINSIPGLLEREYRRLLRQQILDSFAPDYESRAQGLFEQYKLHARAFADGKTKVKVPGLNKEIDVKVEILDQIDKGVSLKSSQWSNVKDWRGSLDAQVINLTHSHGTLQSDDAEKIVIDWTTLPELKQAIEDFLNAEIAVKVGRILSKKYDLLDEEDQAAFNGAFASFEKIGYCKVCFARAMEYAKELELWAKPQL
jgi:predicted Ser/Thr protein kinase